MVTNKCLIEKFKRVYNLLKNKKRWMQGNWYAPMKEIDDCSIKSNSDRLKKCKYCLDGAMEAVCLRYPNALLSDFDKSDVKDAAYKSMHKVFKDIMDVDVISFNDDTTTNHKAVLNSITKCINSLRVNK